MTTIKSKKKDGLSEGTSELLIIETNLTISFSSSWVLDFRLSAHLCTSMQDLEESKKLRDGDMILHVGNGARVAAMVVETYPL